MRIGLAYDLKEAIAEQAHRDDALEEYDSWETVKLIAASLEAGGHTVVMLGGGKEFIDNIWREKVDIVFNIAEGRGNYRSREAQVPSILEMLNISYTGSDPQCLAICLDKPVTKKLVAMAGVCTPKWCVFTNKEELCQTFWDGFPLPAIIKPAYEGSSKGIRLDSIVNAPERVTGTISKLLAYYRQPVILEEFIDGDEITVGIIGNSPPRILGMMRVVPRQKCDRFVYSLEVKRNWKELVDYECPAQLKEENIQEINASSLKVFEVLGCRDFARVDFRVSAEGLPYFIEINPLPGLGTHSDLFIMATKMGWSHPQLIGSILDAALRRYPQCVSM